MRQTVGDFMSNLYWLSEDQMARLLSYLFEVTERFGMETRTELILLQRTMVVVEGVARSLDPQMNIWNTGIAPRKWPTHRDTYIPNTGGATNGWQTRETVRYSAEASPS